MAKKKADLKDAAMVKFEELKKTLWPKTKKEMEKAMANTKKMIDKGENYIKIASEKGMENAKRISLSLRKEKLYYDLGKATAATVSAKWSESKKIADLVKEIKKLDKEIKKIK